MDELEGAYDAFINPPIETAYDDLLASREIPILSGMLDDTQLTDEDILCNTNLHTASLFEQLNTQYNDITIKIERYVDSIKNLDDSANRIEKGLQVFSEECMSHYIQGLNTIQNKSGELKEELSNARVALKIAITQKKDSLEIEQENISRKLNGLRKLILTGVKEIVKPEDLNKKMCPVCFEREVNMVLLPCGHTYCKECSADIDRTRYAKCPQCRSNVNSRVKIFFSI